MKLVSIAYSQPHNNTGEERENNNGKHAQRSGVLEYRNYIAPFITPDGDEVYYKITVMRDNEGRDTSHGANLCDIQIKTKKSANSQEVNGLVKTSVAPTSLTDLSSSTLSSFHDAKIENFFDIA